jgi:hypothetical protein
MAPIRWPTVEGPTERFLDEGMRCHIELGVHSVAQYASLYAQCMRPERNP